MMLFSCQTPIWQNDNLSQCFVESYLQILLPLLLCLTSFLLLLHATVLRSSNSPAARFSSGSFNAASGQHVREVQAQTSAPDWLALRILHLLLGLALIASQLTLLLTNSDTTRSTLAASAGIVAGAYITLVASVRLVRPSDQLLRLHLFTLFGISWLLTAPAFWRAITTATPRSRLIAVIVAFATLTVATITALTLSPAYSTKRTAVTADDPIPAATLSSSILGVISFAWLDPLLRHGYSTTITPDDVPDLEPHQKAGSVKQTFRCIPPHTTFRRRLWRYSRKRQLIQSLWGYAYSFNSFIPPLLVKVILERVEAPQPGQSPWLSVVLLLLSGLFSALSGSQPLWIGRKLTVELQAVIVGEIYDKTVRLKSAAGLDRNHEPGQSEQLSSGQIMNLMSVDSVKVSEGASYLFWMWAEVPTQIIIATVLLIRLLGPAALTGIAIIILFTPVNMFIAKQLTTTQKRVMSASDARIQSTSEILQSIRIVKLFVWQDQLSKAVLQHRSQELRMLGMRFVVLSIASCIGRATPLLMTLVTFYVYTRVQKEALIPSVTFTALSLFTILRMPLDQVTSLAARFQAFRVSLNRLETFLDQPETTKYALLSQTRQSENGVIGFQRALFQWDSGNQSTQYHTSSETSPLLQTNQHTSFSLGELDITFHKGKLNVIIGATGSGKSSLLLALLGEMPLSSGKIYLPSDHGPSSKRVAYCAQQAWLMNDTIRRNIVFYADWDETRYFKTVSACALESDLEILPAGDATIVGEKGIALSGGQKQRIALARAIYSQADCLLLDDCLSAVDTHTAEWVFNQAITGDIAHGRTRILVTHNADLCMPSASYGIILDSGKILAQGHPSELPRSELIGIVSERGSEHEDRTSPELDTADEKKQTKADTQATNKVTTLTEKRGEGSLALKTATTYLSAMGGLVFWVFAIFALVGTPFASVATNLWIRKWSNSYSEHINRLPPAQRLISSSTFLDHWSAFKPTIVANNAYYLKLYGLISLVYLVLSTLRDGVQFSGSLQASSRLHRRLLRHILHARFVFFDTTPFGQIINRFTSDVELLDQELTPVAARTIDCLTSIATTVIVVSVFTPYFLIVGCVLSVPYYLIGKYFLRTSRDLKRIEAVSRSPLYQHFSETYDGLNTIRAFGSEYRFMSENCEKIDAHGRPYISLWAANRWLAFRVDVMGAILSSAAAALVVFSIGKVDPGAAGLNLLYTLTFNENVVFLLRLSSNNEQNFTAVERIKEYLDVDQEAASEIAETEPSAAWPDQGAINFVDYSTSYRQELGPVLRNIYLSIRPGERIGVVGRTGAGKSSLALALFRGLEADKGRIFIDGVDISAIGLNTLRRGLTTVPQDPTLLEGTLRSNADPLNFYKDEQVAEVLKQVRLVKSKATDETRLPPISSSSSLSKSTDQSIDDDDQEDITQATTSNTTFTSIYHPVVSAGSNLSQGQRQLLCIARALLSQKEPCVSSTDDPSETSRTTIQSRRTRILVLDEATSSIDRVSEVQIQSAIRSTDATVITIAHRLRNIADYDRIVVLEKGSIVELGAPAELVEVEGGWFRGLCEGSGELEAIREIAAQKERGGRVTIAS